MSTISTEIGFIGDVSTMACVNYEQLRNKFDSERKAWLYVVSRDNSGLLRKSGSNYRELASDALLGMNSVRRQMFTHRQVCAECNGADAPMPSKTRSAKADRDN